MMSRRGFRYFALPLFTTLCLTSASRAAEAQQAEQPQDARQQALAWLDRFSADQTLFADSDLEQLRSKLAAATETEARQWWEATEQSRQLLASPQWQETHDWFRRFLRVQAMLSDEELADLRARAFKAFISSPAEFREVLEEVQGQRQVISGGALIDARAREQRLVAYRRYRERHEEALLRERQTAQVPRAPQQRAAAIRRDYDIPRPLISSSRVARAVVWNSFWD